jgi:prefoldin subunit 5
MTEKISQEELEKVQGVVQSLREAEASFYRASVQIEEMKQAKAALFAQIQQNNQALQAEMNTLKESYGDIVINLETGEYEPAPVQEAEEVIAE